MINDKALLTEKDRERVKEVRQMLMDGKSPFSHFSENTRKIVKTETVVNQAEVRRKQREAREERQSQVIAWKRFKVGIGCERTIIVRPADPPIPEGDKVTRCIVPLCNVVINPGMSHRARVYVGHINVPVEKDRLVSINPTVQYEEFTERFPVGKFLTGHVCDKCASEYRHIEVETRKGFESIPLVVTLPRPEMTPPEDRTPAFRRGFSKLMRVRGAGKAHYRDDYFTE